MKCKSCNKELEQVGGKKQRVYCDATCRMAWNRRKESSSEGMERMGFTKSEQVISEQPISEQVKRTVSLEDYQDNPSDYATRTKPEKLNWGPYMTVEQFGM